MHFIDVRDCRRQKEQHFQHRSSSDSVAAPGTANLRTNITDVRGVDPSVILNYKGWHSQAHRELPGKFESSNLSRDNASREIGRKNPRPQPQKLCKLVPLI